jgi:hypothetical protein
MIKLREYEGRFTLSTYMCPRCHGETLEDNYPPNYKSLCTEDQRKYTGGQNIKHVCPECAISFLVVTWYETFDGVVVKNEFYTTGEQSLIEKDGVYLTTHDMERECFKTRYGYYPVETFAR